jgi:hypothetical protein
MKFTLNLLPITLAVCHLNATDPVPDWATGVFVSITLGIILEAKYTETSAKMR